MTTSNKKGNIGGKKNPEKKLTIPKTENPGESWEIRRGSPIVWGARQTRPGETAVNALHGAKRGERQLAGRREDRPTTANVGVGTHGEPGQSGGTRPNHGEQNEV